MNREILFRGQRVENKNWVHGHLVKMFDSLGIITLEDESAFNPVIPETIGQYTGLTDKNGVKIFEGDVLDENGYLFTVIWDSKWAKFRLQHDGRAIQFPEWNRGVLMARVGNIHDNPELTTSLV